MKLTRFKRAIQLIDQANQVDPNRIFFEGKSFPKEILYAQRMTASLLDFQPDASEALKIAARAQHIRRWEIPRKSYPMDKKGYHAWRNELKKFHAQKTIAILEEVGYEQEFIEKVSALLQKKQLKRNAETQILEDVICLVFLEFYMEDFAIQYTEAKLISIIQKRWRKMSEAGQQKALLLSLPESVLKIVQKALT